MEEPDNSKFIGEKGEKIAVQFLQTKGYTILEKNWRSSTLEIDVICMDLNLLVFVEVKYRNDIKYGDPVEFISEEKMQNLSIAAGRYIEEKNYKGFIRFDVMGIRPDIQGNYKIRHLRDVHFSGWDP